MRKIISIFTVFLIVSILSTSCSSIGIGKKDKKNITVKMLTNSETRSADLIKHLKEKFPHINIEVTAFETIWQEEQTPIEKRIERASEIIAEEKPDFYYDLKPSWYDKDVLLVDLAQLINRDQIPLNEIQQHIIESETNIDGTLNSITPTFDRKVLFVNRELFQKNGIPVPVTPMTFEDFRNSAQLLKEKNSSLFGYDIQRHSWYFALEEIGKTFQGLQIVSDSGQLMLDQPDWRDLTQQLLDDYKNKILRAEPLSPNKTEIKHIGMSIGNASELYSYLSVNATTDTLSILDLPTNPSNPIINPFIPTSPFSITQSSKYVDEIWEVLTYLMTKEAAVEITNKRLLAGFVAYPGLAPIGDFKIESFAGKETGSKITPSFNLASSAWRKMHITVDELFNAYINNKKDMDEVLDAIAVVVQEINNDSSNFIAVKSDH